MNTASVTTMLPHGHVGLCCRSDRIQLIEGRQVRRWWFWKRWRTYVLAEVPYRIQAGDWVTLDQRGARYQVIVNGNTVLSSPRKPAQHRGFGISFGGQR